MEEKQTHPTCVLFSLGDSFLQRTGSFSITSLVERLQATFLQRVKKLASPRAG
jgi:hypothetical protein